MAREARSALLDPKNFMKTLISEINDDDSDFEATGLDIEIPEDGSDIEHSGSHSIE